MPKPGLRVQDIVDRVQAEARRARRGRDAAVTHAGLWPIGWPHEAPEHPMGVLEAQLAMQRHRECRKEDCRRKAAAWQTLVEARKIRPDTGRNY